MLVRGVAGRPAGPGDMGLCLMLGSASVTPMNYLLGEEVNQEPQALNLGYTLESLRG